MNPVETPKPRVVIFLDIDGVLIKHDQDVKIKDKAKELFKLQINESPNLRQQHVAAIHFFDVRAVENLENLIIRIREFAIPEIVISSTWRLYESVDSLKELFSKFQFSRLIVGKTNDFYMNDLHNARVELIGQWIEEHPEVLNYLIIDDFADNGRMKATYLANFVWVNEFELLTSTNVDAAIRLLNLQMFQKPVNVS